MKMINWCFKINILPWNNGTGHVIFQVFYPVVSEKNLSIERPSNKTMVLRSLSRLVFKSAINFYRPYSKSQHSDKTKKRRCQVIRNTQTQKHNSRLSPPSEWAQSGIHPLGVDNSNKRDNVRICNNGARSSSHCCSGKARSIIYSECVCS